VRRCVYTFCCSVGWDDLFFLRKLTHVSLCSVWTLLPSYYYGAVVETEKRECSYAATENNDT